MKAFTSCMSDYHQRLEIISHLVHHSLTSISNLLMRGISRFKTEAIVNANLVTILRLAQSSAKRLGVFETSLHALQNQVDSSGASYDSKANRLEHSCMLHGYQSGILYQKEYIKHIFSILAFTAFGIKEHRKQQDNLLSLIRRLLSSESLFSKCVGIIGAVVVMEVICRRDHTSNEREHSVTNHSSMDEDVSTVLASQWLIRSSNASSLSLKGPGTGLADDPAEINLLAGDSEEDRGANCSSHSPYVITPPNRLLLQLVGLVEHAIRSHIQLMVFWLDELAFCFNRLTQLNEKNGTSQSVLNGTSTNVPQFSEQGRKLIEWMGARIKRNFQDDFVLDNTSTQNYLTQFSLHDPSLCEIAIALGPSWDRCRSSNPRFPNVGTSNSSSVQKFNRIPNPLLLPAHLNLVAIVVTDQHDGNLDTIDALLGCPLLLPTGFANSELTQLLLEDESISIREPHLAIMTVNWFIEAVNVFAPKLLLTNSSSSQNFHFEAISSTHVSNSARIYCLSILLRLSQIAKLRHCLYRYLVSVYGAKDTQRLEAVEIVETETPNPESNCAPTNNTHEVSWSNLRLPTATYQPATCFSNFTSTSCYKEISQPRFSCGVHLQSFLSSDLDCAFARKRTGVSSKFGTCSNGKEPRAVDVGTKKRRKVCDTSTKSQLNEICDDQDSNASGLSEPTISQDESSTTQLTGSPHSQLSPVPKKRDKKSALLKSSKMASVGTKKLKKSNKNCLMPTLLELTACFRELDLSAIVLGLSSWPWSVKFSSDQMSESNYVVDWTVLTWLLEELSIRLDHITGVSPPVSFGWNAFERLTNLSESVKISYFSYMIPYIISALMRAVDYFTGMTKHKINNDVSVDDVILSSSSSSDEDDSQKVTASKGLQSSPLASKQVSAFDDGVIGSVFSGTGYQISSVLCICLRSLLIFMNGLTNVSSNVDKYLFYCTNSQIIDSMSAFTYDSIQIVANCCKSKIRLNASREIVINEKGVIMLDRCNSLVTHEHDNQQNALFLKRMDEVEGKYFVDVFNENNDLLPVQKEINNLPKIDFVTLSENLRSIIEYLMKNIWPSSLPHANAALFHCRLVFYLTSLYYACHNSLYVSSRSIENAYWVPDLFSYTRDLLDQDWDTSIKWKGQTYRDCLQALLSFHLRCHFYRYEERCSLSHSTNFLVEFTQKRLVPAVQQVMETVVWISKHLCNLAKRVSNPTNLVHLDESSIVAQWNQCVEVLCCITNFFQKSTRQSTSKMIKSNPADKRNPTIHLLPSVMRTGRLFLQGLLKGAMPLLSSLFRHRATDSFLQRICNHAKAYRDSQLTNQIPATRRCLETFVYKVKIMLSQNHCLEAFWLGTLKNRDLHGVELPDDNDSIESDTEAPSTTYQDDSCSVSCSRSSFGDNRNSTSYQAVEKLSSTSRKGRSSTMNQVILGHVDGESVEQEVEELDDETVEEGAVLDDEEDLTEDDGNSDVLEATDEEY
ncbi:unnamed protein product [Heterobilharzia americana]|nr:unnamed protein product [Heterobilharzia americana]